MPEPNEAGPLCFCVRLHSFSMSHMYSANDDVLHVLSSLHRGWFVVKFSQDSQIEEVTHVLSKSFQAFNASVAAPREVVEEEFGDPETTPVIVEGCVLELHQIVF